MVKDLKVDSNIAIKANLILPFLEEHEPEV
jgi:hypothetical protein